MEIKESCGDIIFSDKIKSFSINLHPEKPNPGKPFPVNKLSGNSRYFWRVRAFSGEDAGPWSNSWEFISPSQCRQNIDDDCDGIPNMIEKEVFKTDPGRRTLFVRPCMKAAMANCDDHLPGFYYNKSLDMCFAYWSDFYDGIFPGSQSGRAQIPAFKEVGIEVCVLGAPDNPCEEFKGKVGFQYRPRTKPDYPCDIMEVIAETDSPPDSHGGHTHFMENRWTWSQMGFSSGLGLTGEYGIAVIYLYSMDQYFKEGAYRKIEEGEIPATLDCQSFPEKCKGLNPNNFNDNDPHPNPPYTSKPDDTVEFNEIEFSVEGKIKGVLSKGKSYTKNQVLARTIVHEMGHALLGLKHCQNSCCILYEKTKDWEQRKFGTYCPDSNEGEKRCIHSLGGSRDIKRPWVIHNNIDPIP